MSSRVNAAAFSLKGGDATTNNNSSQYGGGRFKRSSRRSSIIALEFNNEDLKSDNENDNHANGATTR